MKAQPFWHWYLSVRLQTLVSFHVSFGLPGSWVEQEAVWEKSGLGFTHYSVANFCISRNALKGTKCYLLQNFILEQSQSAYEEEQANH